MDDLRSQSVTESVLQMTQKRNDISGSREKVSKHFNIESFYFIQFYNECWSGEE
jgi:hypothetical protein